VDQSNFSDTGLLPETATSIESALGEGGLRSPTLVLRPAVPSDAPNASGLAAHDYPGACGWPQDNAANETHFRVEMQTGGGDFVNRAVLPADTVSTWRGCGRHDLLLRPRPEQGGRFQPVERGYCAHRRGGRRLTLASRHRAALVELGRSHRRGHAVSLERRIGGGDGPLSTVGAGVTALTDEQLIPGQTHVYRVLAEGLLALPGAAATIDVPELPGAPADFAVTAAPDNGEHVRAGWSAGPGGAPAAYQLERRQPPGDYAALDLGADPSVSSHADNSTAALTNYTYRVRP
jgi:hypothetical protein